MMKYLLKSSCAAVAVMSVMLAGSGFGEGISAPLDVTCSAPVLGPDGNPLTGANPSAKRFGFKSAAGTLVQVLDAGPNGVADWPNADGTPGGDDTVFATTAIGQGMAPNLFNSGRFSSSIHPPPPAGSKMFIRIFNAESATNATRWGQSNLYTMEACAVLDASKLGLWGVTQPKTADPQTTDSDGDGYTDYQEFIANTDAVSKGDMPLTRNIHVAGTVQIDARAGRIYRLMRRSGGLDDNGSWNVVASSGVLTMNQNLILADPNPPEDGAAFYRIEVVSP